jgi:C4-dicarboxylate transporter, DctM subunit
MSANESLALIVMCVVFIGFGYLGIPVAFALLAGVLLGAAIFTDVTFTSIMGTMYNGLNQLTLLAIPFFLVVGEVMTSAQISLRLVRFAQSIVGHLRSGLAHVVALASLIFAGISGSATADVVAVGKVMLPSMKQEGYNPAFSAALIASASAIANMVPPSILAIVYGAVSDVSIGGLFLAGATPGVMLCAGLMIYSHFFGPPGTKRQRATVQGISREAKSAAIPLMIPIIIAGGVLSGLFTPSEAGAAAVVYTLFVALPIINRRHFRQLGQDLMNAAVLYSVPMITIASASAFGWMIAFLHGQNAVAGWIQSVSGTNALVILMLITLMFVIVGDFLDSIPAIIIFMPIIIALTTLGHILPLHMAVVVVITLAFGLVTPPYGTSLLIATTLADTTFYQGLKASIALYPVFLIVIGVVIFFPDVALWLPRWLLPQSVGCFQSPNGSGMICPH